MLEDFFSLVHFFLFYLFFLFLYNGDNVNFVNTVSSTSEWNTLCNFAIKLLFNAVEWEFVLCHHRSESWEAVNKIRVTYKQFICIFYGWCITSLKRGRSGCFEGGGPEPASPHPVYAHSIPKPPPPPGQSRKLGHGILFSQ